VALILDHTVACYKHKTDRTCDNAVSMQLELPLFGYTPGPPVQCTALADWMVLILVKFLSPHLTPQSLPNEYAD
jgi:hypothetical protein